MQNGDGQGEIMGASLGLPGFEKNIFLPVWKICWSPSIMANESCVTAEKNEGQ